MTRLLETTVELATGSIYGVFVTFVALLVVAMAAVALWDAR